MSLNILIGKSRKSGKWELLADPSENFDRHLRIYQKIAAGIPVNDDYEKVALGRLQNTSTPLTLLTAEESKKRADSLAATADIAKNAGKLADERQAAIDKKEQNAVNERHQTALDAKNALVNSIRQATGQEVFDETKAEAEQKALTAKLAGMDRNRPSDALTAKRKRIAQEVSEAEAARLEAKSKSTGKSIEEIQAEEKAAALPKPPANHAEEIAAKNALVEKTKQQAQDNLTQQQKDKAESPSVAEKK